MLTKENNIKLNMKICWLNVSTTKTKLQRKKSLSASHLAHKTDPLQNKYNKEPIISIAIKTKAWQKSWSTLPAFKDATHNIEGESPTSWKTINITTGDPTCASVLGSTNSSFHPSCFPCPQKKDILLWSSVSAVQRILSWQFLLSFHLTISTCFSCLFMLVYVCL